MNQVLQSSRVYADRSPPDFRVMTDEDLAAAIALLEQERIVITEELDADWMEGNPRGGMWRQSAGRAKAYRVAHIKLARDEEARRKPNQKLERAAQHAASLDAARALAEAKAREKEATLAEHNARLELVREEKALRKAEAEAVSQRQKDRRARMFWAACCRNMSVAQRDVIWRQAMEMFPSAPELNRHHD